MATATTASQATKIPPKVFQVSGQMRTIPAMYLMQRPRSSSRSPRLSLEASRWTLRIQCLQLHPYLHYATMCSNRECNDPTINRTNLTPCNLTKHPISITPISLLSNRQASILTNPKPASRQIMPFPHTTSSTLLWTFTSNLSTPGVQYCIGDPPWILYLAHPHWTKLIEYCYTPSWPPH